MGSADHYVLGRDPRPRSNRFACGKHNLTRNHQRIDAHQRHALWTIAEYCRPYLAGIVEFPVKGLSVAAGLFHADIGCNIALREPGFQQPFSGGVRRWRTHCRQSGKDRGGC